MSDDLQKIWAFLLYLFDHDVPYMIVGLAGVVMFFLWLTVPLWGDWAAKWFKRDENGSGNGKQNSRKN